MDMSRREHDGKLVGGWRSLHAIIWLAGLAVLGWTGWWWPGIFVLIVISIAYEAILRQFAPRAFEAPEPEAPPFSGPISPPPPFVREHQAELLPSTCPNCGGPIRGHEVIWTGPQSADCPYCRINLPMVKA
jgi:hypothetical protein